MLAISIALLATGGRLVASNQLSISDAGFFIYVHTGLQVLMYAAEYSWLFGSNKSVATKAIGIADKTYLVQPVWTISKSTHTSTYTHW
ncbi:hypothetical protein BC830DRAFT_641898 [Chytriomyces sp. MP71]|nr:hypothetical protein BC830DRAFT_641898 [Chytriomyces sp. MP71]